MLRISHELLQEVTPRPVQTGRRQQAWDAYVEALTSDAFAELLGQWRVTTPKRLASFLGQMAHECGGWTILRESGNYKTVEILLDRFGKGKHSAAITRAEAEDLLALPTENDQRARAIFERVYGMGNPRKAAELGNVSLGDAYECRGTGPMQITGLGAHQRYAKRIGCTLQQLVEPLYGLHAALLEWSEKGCNTLADRGDVRGVTRRINGGLNGFDDRVRLTNAFLSRLDDDVIDVVPVEEARAAQERLNALNYTLGTPDGEEDHASRGAVFAFQDANGIVPTGVLDRATVNAIMAPGAKPLPVPPERAHLTAKDLAERGSQDVIVARRDKDVAALGIFGTLMTWIDQLLGGTVLDTISTVAAKINGLMANFGGSLAQVPRSALASLAIVAVCLFWWRSAQAREARRVEKARTGADLSK